MFSKESQSTKILPFLNGQTSEKPDFVKITHTTYFDVLNTNMTMKIRANDIFKVKRTKNSSFKQFFEIFLNTSYRSENSSEQKL